MKIVRLTTTQNEAIFDGNINGNLVMPPGSKIAFQSASINVLKKEVDITFQTSGISYDLGNNITRNFNLKQGNYNTTNLADLEKDFTDRLNGTCAVKASDGTLKMMGSEWGCGVDDNEFFFGYGRGVYGEHQAEQTLGTNVERISTNGGTYQKKTGEVASTSIKEDCLVGNYNLALGNSVARARIGRLEREDDGAGGFLSVAHTGFIVGFLPSDGELNPDNVNNTNVRYGLRCRALDDGTRDVISVVDGVEVGTPQTISTYAPDGTANEFVEVAISGDEILFNLYQTDGTQIVVNRIPWNNNIKFAPVIGFFGTRGNSSANYYRTIPSPFTNTQASTGKPQKFSPESYTDVGALPPRPPNSNPNDINTFTFQSISLANFLGFENLTQTAQGGGGEDDEIEFIADKELFITQEADSYLVELLNLSTICYDTYSDTPFQGNGQRKNLLAIIPSSNEVGKLVFYDENPTFIDLDNKSDIVLRNIKLRVVRNDYSPVPIQGLGTIVILLE